MKQYKKATTYLPLEAPRVYNFFTLQKTSVVHKHVRINLFFFCETSSCICCKFKISEALIFYVGEMAKKAISEARGCRFESHELVMLVFYMKNRMT